MVEIWTFEQITSVASLAAQSATVVALGLTGSAGAGNEGRPYRISRLEVIARAKGFATDEAVTLWECSAEISGSDMMQGFTGQYNNNNELIERARARTVGKLIGQVGRDNPILNDGLFVAVTPNRSHDPAAGDELSIAIANFDNDALSANSQEVHIHGKAYGVWL